VAPPAAPEAARPRVAAPVLRATAGALLSGLLIAAYARGGACWPIGFVALVPWLWTLRRVTTWRGASGSAIAMSIAYAFGALGWFAPAFGAYVGLNAVSAAAILVLAAPLLQPQVLAFALVHRATRHSPRPLLRVVAAAAAWVAMEWLAPKLLGDTLAHGLQPSTWMRQAADLGGAAGLTVVLLLANAGIALALDAGRGAWRLLLAAVLLVAATAGYGAWRLASLSDALSAPAPALRVGLVQANLADVERRRAERGTHAALREILDVHWTMSAHAVRAQGAEALVWSETTYPTTFGQPKSEDGATFDAELVEGVAGLGVPLVFGTYDRDAAGEYNSAAFLEPARGLLGHYRKTHLFPFTERVPAWLDGEGFRRLFPWTGSWRPGHGARVFPLQVADGREASVLPLICLDDVRTQLAIDGARLGAQAIVGLSNDSWFSAHPDGARLHLAVATFRSIETRLPQLRVTTNGLSALVDETGEVLVQTTMGQQAVLVGDIPLRDPVPTLMVRLGDWVGRAALLFLLAMLAARGLARTVESRARAARSAPPAVPSQWQASLVLLAPGVRACMLALRLVAAGALAWLVLRMALGAGWQVNAIEQIAVFALGVVLPLLAEWGLRRARAAQARIVDGALVLAGAARHVEIPIASIRALRVESLAWLTAPHTPVALELASGQVLRERIEMIDPAMLATVLRAAGAALHPEDAVTATRLADAAARATAYHRILDHGAVRHALFPLLLALPAFRLHQHIAFGGTFGEYLSYGLGAWLGGLLIWWAAWSLGLMLYAVVLRVLVEIANAATRVSRHRDTAGLRPMLEHLARALYFLGPPVWLLTRVL